MASGVRKLFRWEVSTAVVGVLIGLAGITFAVDLFGTTAIILLAAGIYSAGCIWHLDFFNHAGGFRRSGFFALIGIVLLSTATLAWLTFVYGEKKELEKLTGVIAPGNGPTPKPPNFVCHGFGDFDLILGQAHFYSHLADPDRTIIQIDDRPVLALKREPGEMALSLTVRGDDNKVIVDITNGVFRINANNYFYMEHSSKHELAVYDQYKKKVLALDYPSKHALMVKTDLYSDRHHVVITADAIQIDGRVVEMLAEGPSFCVAIPGGAPDIIIDASGVYTPLFGGGARIRLVR